MLCPSACLCPALPPAGPPSSLRGTVRREPLPILGPPAASCTTHHEASGWHAGMAWRHCISRELTSRVKKSTSRVWLPSSALLDLSISLLVSLLGTDRTVINSLACVFVACSSSNLPIGNFPSSRGAEARYTCQDPHRSSNTIAPTQIWAGKIEDVSAHKSARRRCQYMHPFSFGADVPPVHILSKSCRSMNSIKITPSLRLCRRGPSSNSSHCDGCHATYVMRLRQEPKQQNKFILLLWSNRARCSPDLPTYVRSPTRRAVEEACMRLGTIAAKLGH